MPRIWIALTALVIATSVFAQTPSNNKEMQQHGSGGTGWSGEGGARNASQNHPAVSTGYYTAPVATGLDLRGPTKTEGPFAE